MTSSPSTYSGRKRSIFAVGRLSLSRGKALLFLRLALVALALTEFTAVRDEGEGAARISIGRSQFNIEDVPSCVKNFSQIPCDENDVATVYLQGPKESMNLGSSSIHSDKLLGVVAPGNLSYPGNHPGGTPKCPRERQKRFDVWYGGEIENLDQKENEAILIALPNWIAECVDGLSHDIFGNPVADIYWIIQDEVVRGEMRCKHFGVVKNPSCGFEIYLQNGRYTWVYSRINSANALALIEEIPKIAASFFNDFKLAEARADIIMDISPKITLQIEAEAKLRRYLEGF